MLSRSFFFVISFCLLTSLGWLARPPAFGQGAGACHSVWTTRLPRALGLAGPTWPENGKRVQWSLQRSAFLIEGELSVSVFGQVKGGWTRIHQFGRELLFPPLAGQTRIAHELVWAPDGKSLLGVQTHSGGWRVQQVLLSSPREVRQLDIPLPADRQIDATRVQQEQYQYETNLQWLTPESAAPNYLMIKSHLSRLPRKMSTLLVGKRSWGVVLMIELNHLRFDAAIGAGNHPQWDIRSIYRSRTQPGRILATFVHPQFENHEIEIWDLPNSKLLVADRNLRPEYVREIESDSTPAWNYDRVRKGEPQMANQQPVLLESSPQKSYYIKRSPVPGWGGRVSWALDLIRFVRETVNEERPYRQVLLASIQNEFLAEDLSYHWVRNGDVLLIREREGRLVVWDHARRELSLASGERVMQLGGAILLIDKASGGHKEARLYDLHPWTYVAHYRLDASETIVGLTERGHLLTVSFSEATGDMPLFQEHIPPSY